LTTNGKPGGERHGSVAGRSQFQATNGNWVKRDTSTGRIMDQKTSNDTPFKGVRKEKNLRELWIAHGKHLKTNFLFTIKQSTKKYGRKVQGG